MVAVELRGPGQVSVEEEGLRAQGLMVSVHSPTYGEYWRHGALHQFSASQPTFGSWEPVGGHTRSVLLELGYREEEIDRLVGERIVEAAAEG
jgi:crotonobetainyl-CoA:carnitine CoA-transferase CaiB-like acyl-CoA transferase